MKHFNKILIANRGEIAVRIIRTARKLGLQTVALYTPVEANALHVRLSDEAYNLGDGNLADTWLNISKVVEIAVGSGCDLIHPGYGFLSERQAFARACEEAGIAFVGPGEEAIRLMGHKIESREFAVSCGLPVGRGAKGSHEALVEAAKSIPFPILVKAAAGGGGKGMRIVREPDQLAAALESTSREAASYFGDGTVYIEQFIENPRHIEVQILGDTHGNVIHLFERECSIQRRYQKIIEESPSPTLTSEVRQKMCEAAVQLGKSAGYHSAGTIEFLVDHQLNFYFLEMNTRIQVEHPVTEMVTGIDIVEEQILIAAGQPLRLKQETIQQNGHAIECRIYAEDPSNNFLPSPGNISLYQEPSGPGIRVDSSIDQPVTILPDFDPMIAKLVCHGKDRSMAIHRMHHALLHYPVLGIHTNHAYLQALLGHPDYLENRISTHFCEDHHEALTAGIAGAKAAYPKHNALMGFVLYSLQQKASTPPDIWQEIGYWRHTSTLKVRMDGESYEIGLRRTGQNHWVLRSGDTDYTAVLHTFNSGKLDFTLNDVRNQAYISGEKGITGLMLHGHVYSCSREDILVEQELLSQSGFGSDNSKEKICSPMPGKVVKINVEQGQSVVKGQVLLIVEAMKTENNICAGRDGIVKKVNVSAGESVDTVTELIHLEDEST